MSIWMLVIVQLHSEYIQSLVKSCSMVMKLQIPSVSSHAYVPQGGQRVIILQLTLLSW